MTLSSASVNATGILKNARQRLNNESIQAMNLKTVKGNTGGLLTTVNEMNGTFYESTDEFYNIVSQYVFLDLNVVYAAVIQEARVLQQNDVFQSFVNNFYNDRFMTCLMNYYKHSPSFFKVLFPQNPGKKNIHQSFQKYYYLLCIIEYTNENANEDHMKSLPLNVYNNIVEWCRTRNDPNIAYQLAGPIKNQVVSFNFMEHYQSLISVQNSSKDIVDYNKLVRLQNVDDGVASLLKFLREFPNVYHKNADIARQYVLNIDTRTIENKMVQNNGRLTYDISSMDFGDTSSDTTGARLDEIDRLQTYDVTLSKNNLKRLEKIFNMYSRIKIESLTVDKHAYVPDISKYDIVYLVFGGISCSDRTIGSNKNIANGDLAIPGKFTLNDAGEYVFKTLTEYTTYRPERTRVKKCELYLATDRYTEIVPYSVALNVTRKDLFNIPIYVSFSEATAKSFAPRYHRFASLFKSQQANANTNICYLIIPYDKSFNESDVLYMYDTSSGLVNTIPHGKLTDQALARFFDENHTMTNRNYFINMKTHQITSVSTIKNLLYDYDAFDTANYLVNDIIDDPEPMYAIENHTMTDVVKSVLNPLTTVSLKSNDSKGFFPIAIYDPSTHMFIVEFPFLDSTYVCNEDGLTNISSDSLIQYVLTSSDGKTFDRITASGFGKTVNEMTHVDILPMNPNMTINQLRPFLDKQFTQIIFEYTASTDPAKGLLLTFAGFSYNTSSMIAQQNSVNVDRASFDTIFDPTDPSKSLVTINGLANTLERTTGVYTTNVFFNPFNASDLYDKAFDEDILNNSISLVPISSKDVPTMNIFSIVPGNMTSEYFTTSIDNCWVATDLNGTKQWYESINVIFNNGQLTVGDNTANKFYIWRENISTKYPLKYTIASADIRSTTTKEDAKIPSSLTDDVCVAVLLSNTSTGIIDCDHGANILQFIYTNLVKLIITANGFGNGKNSLNWYGQDIFIELPTKYTIDNIEGTVLGSNVVIVFKPYLLSHLNGDLSSGTTAVAATISVIKIEPMIIDEISRFTYSDSSRSHGDEDKSATADIYNKTFVLMNGRQPLLAHAFNKTAAIHLATKNDISNVFITDTNGFILENSHKHTHANLFINNLYVSSYSGNIRIHGIEVVVPTCIDVTLISNCRSLTTNGSTLTEQYIRTIRPSNIYTDIAFDNDRVIDIAYNIGETDYTRKFTYLYKHIYDDVKNVVINSSVNIASHDLAQIDGHEFVVEKINGDTVVLASAHNDLEVTAHSVTVNLIKREMYLTLSWS